MSTDIRAANLLLIGHAAAAREHLLPMMPSLAEPIVGLDGGDLHLPTEHVGTLLVWDIARLTRTNQEQLLEWMVGRQGSCRIIATSARSLFPDVQDGTFSDALYYRLNTVIVVLPGHKMLAASRRDRTILRRA